MARCERAGIPPASHAMTASTANSGSVWTQARRKADSSMLGNVQSAASAAPPPCIAAASSFRVRTGVQDTMAREHFHESHTEVPAPVASGISFQELVHEMLEQL